MNLAAELRELLPAHLVCDDPESLTVYGYDACTVTQGRAGVVVHASAEEHVVEVLRWADAHRVPVYPRGAGTGLAGGSMPDGGIVINLAPMNRILRIDTEGLFAVVEPGVVNAQLQEAVESLGLFYPPDPASLRQSTLGGNVATCAGGPRCLKYGVTREYVRGVRAVLPGGQVLTDGGLYLKNSSGYNISQLFVGSEGTLGVVTQIILRLIPRPPVTGALTALFDDVERAAEAVNRILQSGLLPSVLEFMDRECLWCVSQATAFNLDARTGALLLLESDGTDTEVDRSLEQMAELAASCGAWSVVRATQAAEREELWRVRRAISSALSQLRPAKLGEDISLPRGAVIPMLRRLESIRQQYCVLMPVFGHIGDGNLHPNPLFDPRDADETRRALEAAEAVVRAAVDLGGAVSGEHGIGVIKKDLLKLSRPAQNRDLCRRLRAVFDPHGIMNPGKIFDLAE